MSGRADDEIGLPTKSSPGKSFYSDVPGSERTVCERMGSERALSKSSRVTSPQSSSSRKRSRRRLVNGELLSPWVTRFTKQMRKLDEEDEVQVGPSVQYDDSFVTSSRKRVAQALATNWYETAIGIVIVVNAAVIGLEQSLYLLDSSSAQLREALSICEHVFLAIYILEIIANFYALGLKCMESRWMLFNCFLVLVGIAVSWVLEPGSQGHHDDAHQTGRSLMVLRTLRLLRLVRTIHLLIRFKELSMLVHGLMHSASTMVCTIVLLTVILFIFSSIGIELVTNNPRVADDPEIGDLVERYFSNLPQIMLTLLQFVCMDSIHIIYRPLIEKDPVLVFYFVLIILVVAIVVMNLVTAVIVNGAFEEARKMQEAKRETESNRRRQLVKELRKVFLHLDKDNSGTVSREELQNIDQADHKILAEATAISDPLDIFLALDVDNRGSLDIDEFCEGVWQVVVSQSPIEMRRLEKQMDAVRRDMIVLHQQHNEVLQAVTHIRRSLDLPSEGMISALSHGQVTAFAQRLRKSAVSACSDGPTENCISGDGDDSKTGGFESEDLDGVLSEREVQKSAVVDSIILDKLEVDLRAIRDDFDASLEAAKSQLDHCVQAVDDMLMQVQVCGQTPTGEDNLPMPGWSSFKEEAQVSKSHPTGGNQKPPAHSRGKGSPAASAPATINLRSTSDQQDSGRVLLESPDWAPPFDDRPADNHVTGNNRRGRGGKSARCNEHSEKERMRSRAPRRERL